MYTTLLFDADSTLFDFPRAEREAFFATIPSAAEADYRFYSAENDKLWHKLNAGEVTKDFLVLERWRILFDHMRLNLTPASVNEAYKAALGAGSYLIDGAEALCRTLRSASRRLYIITNGMGAVQRARFERSPIRDLFDDIFISEEIGAVKPHPAYFTAVADAIPYFDKAAALIIGDTPDSDIKGGMLSGIDTVWYNPQNKPCPADITPTYTVSSYDEIVKIVL